MKQRRLALLLEREGSCQTLRHNCLHLGTTKNPQDLVIRLRKSWLKNPLEPPARNIGSNRLFAMKLHPYFLEIIIYYVAVVSPEGISRNHGEITANFAIYLQFFESFSETDQSVYTLFINPANLGNVLLHDSANSAISFYII